MYFITVDFSFLICYRSVHPCLGNGIRTSISYVLTNSFNCQKWAVFLKERTFKWPNFNPWRFLHPTNNRFGSRANSIGIVLVLVETSIQLFLSWLRVLGRVFFLRRIKGFIHEMFCRSYWSSVTCLALSSVVRALGDSTSPPYSCCEGAGWWENKH